MVYKSLVGLLVVAGQVQDLPGVISRRRAPLTSPTPSNCSLSWVHPYSVYSRSACSSARSRVAVQPAWGPFSDHAANDVIGELAVQVPASTPGPRLRSRSCLRSRGWPIDGARRRPPGSRLDALPGRPRSQPTPPPGRCNSTARRWRTGSQAAGSRPKSRAAGVPPGRAAAIVAETYQSAATAWRMAEDGRRKHGYRRLRQGARPPPGAPRWALCSGRNHRPGFARILTRRACGPTRGGRVSRTTSASSAEVALVSRRSSEWIAMLSPSSLLIVESIWSSCCCRCRAFCRSRLASWASFPRSPAPLSKCRRARSTPPARCSPLSAGTATVGGRGDAATARKSDTARTASAGDATLLGGP